jgi:SAM domain (Sterile alpha motif)
MKDVAEWLASLELGEYAQRFAENAIDLSVIRDLTENDLKELGVLLGHRRKMLRAIAELQRAPATPQMASEPARERADAITWRMSSGSSRAASAVDPTRSQNITVSWRSFTGAWPRLSARFLPIALRPGAAGLPQSIFSVQGWLPFRVRGAGPRPLRSFA